MVKPRHYSNLSEAGSGILIILLLWAFLLVGGLQGWCFGVEEPLSDDLLVPVMLRLGSELVFVVASLVIGYFACLVSKRDFASKLFLFARRTLLALGQKRRHEGSINALLCVLLVANGLDVFDFTQFNLGFLGVRVALRFFAPRHSLDINLDFRNHQDFGN